MYKPATGGPQSSSVDRAGQASRIGSDLSRGESIRSLLVRPPGSAHLLLPLTRSLDVLREPKFRYSHLRYLRMSINLQAFFALPDSSRIWIHGLKEPLNERLIAALQQSLDRFLSDWSSHGTKVKAACIIEQSRFLITAAHCATGISGCSIDKYVHVLKALGEESGLDLLNGNLVFYRDTAGQIQAVDHLDFYDLVEGKKVSENTPVFDTLLRTLEDLRQDNFERPFKDSWHRETYLVCPD